MRNIKNTFLVSVLSLGLIVGAVGLVSAATSTDYQQKIATGANNDPNPVVINNNSSTTDVTTSTDSTATAASASTTDTNATQYIGNLNQSSPSDSQPVPQQVIPQNHMAMQQSQNMHYNGSNGIGSMGNQMSGHMGW